MQSNYAIITSNLTRDFSAIRAVDNLNLEIPKSSIFGFLGPNGSGKTTTIRLLLGLLEPTIGYATVLGFNSNTEPQKIRENCGALLENNGLYERLTAEQNLDFYGRIWQIPAKEREQRIYELLKKVNLFDRRKDKVNKWSKGMKQKLAIARSLIHNPQLLFLDEPTAGLDPIASVALREDLESLAKDQGITIFLTTHNLAEAEKLCDLVGVVHQGKLLSLDSPKHLRQQSSNPILDIYGSGITPDMIRTLREQKEITAIHTLEGGIRIHLAIKENYSPIISFLVSHGAEIEEVKKVQADLEEVFIKIVDNNLIEVRP